MSNEWSSFQKDKLLMEAWRRHLNEETEKMEELFGFGKEREKKWADIASGADEPGPPTAQSQRQRRQAGQPPRQASSPSNEYSRGKLENILKGINIPPTARAAVLQKVGELVKRRNITLEEADLGQPHRTFTPEDTQELLGVIKDLNLEQAQQDQLIDALMTWGKMNSVTISSPAPSAVAPQTEPEPQPGPEPEPEPEPEDPAGEGIFIYKGKAGKGLQSTLDKGGIPGNIKSIVLKHIAKQLQKQGLTVQEIKRYGFPADLLNEMLEEQQRSKKRKARQKKGAARGEGSGTSARAQRRRAARQAAAATVPSPEPEVTPEPEAPPETPPETPPEEEAPPETAPEATAEPSDRRRSAPEGTQAALQQKRAGTSGAPQVGVYNHPAGKQHSLNQTLQDAGYTGEDLGKLMDMVAAWGKAQGLKINEMALTGTVEDVLAEARIARWKQLVRG